MSTTNGIENLIGTGEGDDGWREALARRAHDPALVCRGVLEAERRFRRVNGYRQIPILVAALRHRDAELDATASPDSAVTAA